MAGFFIKVKDMVAAISWVPWWMPTKYALDGSIENVFAGQTYTSAGGDVSGDDLLENVFDLVDIDRWVSLVIVFLFTLLFRVFHYVLTWWETRKFN